MLQFSTGRLQASAASDQKGSHESAGAANAEAAVNQNFFTGTDAVFNPGQYFFQLFQGRGLLIRNRQLIHIETGMPLTIAQVKTFST